jgi:CubicO group peptidase (beta-lactamase class C family)
MKNIGGSGLAPWWSARRSRTAPGPSAAVDTDPSTNRRPDSVAVEQLLRIASLSAGLLVILILVFQALRPGYAFRPPPGAPEPVFKSYLDRTAPIILDHFGIPGMVVTTVVRGTPARTYAYGLADRDHRRPMTADTIFRVASISKSLTAWGVLRMVEAGQVDLDAPVQRYLDHWPLPKSSFPTSGVTLRRLLNHTSGLNAGADIFRRPQERVLSAWELLSREGDGPEVGPALLASRPGELFRYSVPGYTILTLVIEERSHRPFQEFMKSEVLRPLGMTSSSFDWDRPLQARTATPYLGNGHAMPVLVPQDLAADSLFSTGPDLARYLAAPLPGNEPAATAGLPAKLVGKITATPNRLPRIELEGLRFDGPSLGRFVERLPDGRMAVTNGGYDPGWSSQFYLIPSTGEGVVVLTNSEAGRAGDRRDTCRLGVLARPAGDEDDARALCASARTSPWRSEFMVMISLYFGSERDRRSRIWGSSSGRAHARRVGGQRVRNDPRPGLDGALDSAARPHRDLDADLLRFRRLRDQPVRSGGDGAPGLPACPRPGQRQCQLI